MYEKVMSTFSEKVECLIKSEDTDLKKAECGINLCIKTLSKLQKLVAHEDFEDSQSEIDFFKNIKPYPMSYLIYFTEVRSCELLLPKAGNSHKVRFLKKEIKKINKFFSANNGFVHYMEQNHSYLDHQFFNRQGQVDFSLTPSINYYENPEFSTSHDMLWAKVQALYRYIHYIREQLERLEPGSSSEFRERQPNLLIWSGGKTDLIELIYALFASGYLNHGTSDIITICKAFEDIFNIKLDNPYKTYSNIKARKGDRTKFLNLLIMLLEAKMNKDDD